MSNYKERPILFSGEMVRAILDGRKTQTRRPVTPQPPDGHNDITAKFPHNGGMMFAFENLALDSTTGATVHTARCPWQPGDRLWVRETFAFVGDYRGIDPGTTALSQGAFYRADHPHGIQHENSSEYLRWRPSIHMPRHVARIILEVERVRVERVREISEADARAEGYSFRSLYGMCDEEDQRFWSLLDEDPEDHARRKGWSLPRDWFEQIWAKINGPKSWHSNPWAWVITFKVVKQ